nr:hypothetical protein [uncultured Cardiobacterium sp.]
MARPVSTSLGGRKMGFSPSSGRSLLFAFRVDVTVKRENYALFAFETLQAMSLRFSFYRSAVVLSEQPLKGINAKPTKQAQPAFCISGRRDRQAGKLRAFCF